MLKRTDATFLIVAGLMYPVLFHVTLDLLPFLKQVVTGGHAGPGTASFCTSVLCPICFLALGIVIGRHMAFAHAGIAILMSIWVYIQYPVEPLMNFSRQMAYMELPGKLQVAYLAGFVYYIIYAAIIIRKKMHKSSNKPLQRTRKDRAAELRRSAP